MAVIREIWTDNLTLISARTLARGSLKRAVLDLSGTGSPIDAAKLFVRIGRTDATALAATAGVAGVSLRIRELFNGAAIKHPSSGSRDRLSGTAAALVGLINNGAGYVAGTSTFAVDTTSLVPAAGVQNNLCFTGSASSQAATANDTALSNVEFAIGSFSSVTSLIIDSPCSNARIDNELITTQADIFTPIIIPGGQQWEIICDYGDDTAGSDVIIEVLYKTMRLTKASI